MKWHGVGVSHNEACEATLLLPVLVDRPPFLGLPMATEG
jgi:hypothetical protein